MNPPAKSRRSRASRGCILLCCAAALAACAGSSGGPFGAAVPDTAGRDYLALAMGYFEAGDLAAARHHLQNARQNHAAGAEIDHIAALLAAAEDDFESADRLFRRALGLAPENSALGNNYGALLYSLQRDIEALAHFRAAAADETYHGRAHALENLGRALLRRQRPDEALEAFASALDMNGELPVATLELSLLHRRNGNLAEAGRLYRDYLAIAERQRLVHGPKALLAGAEFA